MKAQIEEYKEDCLRNVEKYVAKVIESAELCEQKQVTTQIYLQNTHVTDVVKARVEMMRELDALLTGNIEQWKFDADQKQEEKRLCPLRAQFYSSWSRDQLLIQILSMNKKNSHINFGFCIYWLVYGPSKDRD